LGDEGFFLLPVAETSDVGYVEVDHFHVGVVILNGTDENAQRVVGAGVVESAGSGEMSNLDVGFGRGGKNLSQEDLGFFGAIGSVAGDGRVQVNNDRHAMRGGGLKNFA
jgi:hypothetical protein